MVAEGVETRPRWIFWARCNASVLQGYHLSRPQTAADITNWLQQRIALREAQNTGNGRTSQS
jgi:EAL domain-containing protein (putative c-di-GMP-specific phosphodiesterase class I)